MTGFERTCLMHGWGWSLSTFFGPCYGPRLDRGMFLGVVDMRCAAHDLAIHWPTPYTYQATT